MTDCPECAPGAAHPHDEPSRPHIHLTDYGYLIYAPDHEQRDFIEEIRVFERRAIEAGLEDGTLGYIPAGQLAEVTAERDQTLADLQLIRGELAHTQHTRDKYAAERDQYRIDLGQADTVLTDITGLHKPHTNSVGRDWCKACNALWPCRTWKAMEVTAPVPGSSRRAQETDRCGPDCSEGHTYMAGCAIKPPARAFLGEKPCGRPGCPCGGTQ